MAAFVLKDYQTTLHDDGLGGFKAFNTIPPKWDPTTKTFAGAVQVRYWWFEQ